MRALQCVEHGPPERLVINELPSPVAGLGEVVITVKAAALNFPDVLIIQNKYQVKPPLPFTPGSELAGIVKDVGEGVTTVKPGDRVMAFIVYGAFAEEVKVEANRVLPVPDDMDLATASALLMTYGTMEHGLRDRGALQPGESVLVLGASGGIGLASIEIAKALGARVLAATSTDDKLEACREHGADGLVNYTTGDLREAIRAFTDGRGIDVVVDPIGGAYTEPALRSMAWRGRLLVVGFAAGEIPRIPLNVVLLKGAAVVGVFWGEFLRREPAGFDKIVERLAAWYRSGRITPHVSATFSLDHAVDALELMAARKAVGKLVITM